VLTAASAGAARALFDAPGEAPDLLICDFSLPDGDGLALVREVRRIHRALRVILVSGYADTAMREACVELGIRFLAKPVPASILLQAATDSMPVVATGENI
jgi:CheY-like chemotaxis protein